MPFCMPPRVLQFFHSVYRAFEKFKAAGPDKVAQVVNFFQRRACTSSARVLLLFCGVAALHAKLVSMRSTRDLERTIIPSK